MFKFSGTRPDTLGVRDGRLAACGSKPNCVCSHDAGTTGGDPQHVQPFTFSGDGAEAMTRIVAVLLARPDCKIVTQSRDYVHAEFSSKFFGFVDDIEFYLPQGASEVHLRSASRLGYSDFGVNRARVEELREAFDDAD